MKKLKLKFADRLSATFILLFVILMLLGTVFVINFLKFQDFELIRQSYNIKIEEVNTYLDKIDSFSKKYDKITLEFNPKFENQIVTYSKPFEPGVEKFLYIIRVRNSKSYDEIALNTFNSKDIMNTIKSINNVTGDNVNNKKFNKFNIDNKTYSVIRINRKIGGNVFDVYILKDISNNISTYKTLILLLLLYTLIGIMFIIIISNYLTKRLLKPINNIITTAKSISTKDLTVRIDNTNTNDELDNLITIINNMLERLNISFDNQSKFISDVSHELRTPLAIMMGYTDFIKRHSNYENEVINESLTLVIDEANNMKNLIDKLLFLAKGDANTVKINIETFDSLEFITKLRNDAEYFAKEHNIVIDKNVKYTLCADKSLLLQALRTIIENSVKYSPKHTNIYINSYYDEINKEAVLSIRDEGIGIEPQYFDKIFERFYRIDESRTKETGGTGLGLSIVKKILAIHNGRIEVKSKINEGSEFIMYIPSKINITNS